MEKLADRLTDLWLRCEDAVLIWTLAAAAMVGAIGVAVILAVARTGLFVPGS
jgi:hypothetical protein